MAITFVCVIALIQVPENMLQQRLQPIDLDALIMQKRLFNKVSGYSPVLGMQEDILAEDVRLAARLDPSEKKFGYRITVSKGPTVYGNKDFFVAAYPLARLYDTFTEVKRMKQDGSSVSVSLVQVYPKKYEN